MKLYKIAEDFQQVKNISDVPEEAIEDTLEAIKGEFNEKAKALVSFVLNKEYEIEMLKSHKADVDSRIKAIESRNERLRHYLRYNMESCEIFKIESPFFTITLGKEYESVEIENLDHIPDNYIKVEKKPQKTEIKKALKRGDHVPGAHIKLGKKSLRIKKS